MKFTAATNSSQSKFAHNINRAGTKSSSPVIQHHQNPATESHHTSLIKLPPKLSVADLDSVASAVQAVVELTTSLGQLMGMIRADMDVITKPIQ
jgi:hypothetical protein